jgi:hypothetical protein
MEAVSPQSKADGGEQRWDRQLGLLLGPRKSRKGEFNILKR